MFNKTDSHSNIIKHKYIDRLLRYARHADDAHALDSITRWEILKGNSEKSNVIRETRLGEIIFS